MAASAEYQASLDAIKRRRAIAEQLGQASMQYGGTQMSGTGRHPIAVATSPWEVASKLGQAYFAKKGVERADKEYGEIAKAMGADKQKALDALLAGGIGGGTYEQDPMADAEQGPTRGVPVAGKRGTVTPQTRQAAIDAGIDPSVIAAATKGPERFSLSPGEVVKDETGALIAEGSPKLEGEGSLKIVIGADGKPRYARAGDAIGQEAPQSTGVQVNVGDKLPTPPQGMAYVKDPTSQFGYRLEKIPGARDTRTGAEQKASLLSQRMNELSGDVMNEAPSIANQQAANYAQKGGFIGAMANGLLGEKQQKHFNAARGWLAGILRQDTGATISPQEVEQYYPTYFPVPGDSASVIDQKRRLREVTQTGLASIGGDEPSQAPKPPSGNVNDRVSSYYD